MNTVPACLNVVPACLNTVPALLAAPCRSSSSHPVRSLCAAYLVGPSTSCRPACWTPNCVHWRCPAGRGGPPSPRSSFMSCSKNWIQVQGKSTGSLPTLLQPLLALLWLLLALLQPLLLPVARRVMRIQHPRQHRPRQAQGRLQRWPGQ